MTNDTTTLSGSLQELGETMASNLVAMGVSGADASDGLTTLAQNILNIAPAVGGITPTVSIDLSKSPTIVCRGANLVINALVNADYDDESVADVDLKGYLQGATITFKNGNTDLGYAVSDSDGIATLVVQNVQQGNYSITANFDGTGTDYESATSDALTFTVNDYPTITLTADKTTVAVGETVTFTVTAMYNNSPVVGYPIQLYKDGSSLGSSYRDITNNDGEAVITYTISNNDNDMTMNANTISNNVNITLDTWTTIWYDPCLPTENKSNDYSYWGDRPSLTITNDGMEIRGSNGESWLYVPYQFGSNDDFRVTYTYMGGWDYSNTIEIDGSRYNRMAQQGYSEEYYNGGQRSDYGHWYGANGNNSSYDIVLSAGDTITYERISGKIYVKINGTTLNPNGFSNTTQGYFTFETYKGDNRMTKIKDLKVQIPPS